MEEFSFGNINIKNRNMDDFFSGCFITIIVCILWGAFCGLIFMLLWNWIAPLFWVAAPHLTFWQSWGVCILLSWVGSFFSNKSK